MKAQMFNTELNKNYATMVVDGKIPASSIEAAQELIRMQRIFVHENGPIRWSPEFANLLRTKDGTRLNTDAIKDSLSNIQYTIIYYILVYKEFKLNLIYLTIYYQYFNYKGNICF